MLTSKGKSRFLLVKIKHRRRFLFSIPIAFNVFNELLEAVQELVDVVESFIPKDKRKFEIRHISSGNPFWTISIGEALRMLTELFMELQSFKGLRLTEVETEDVYVKVEFF